MQKVKKIPQRQCVGCREMKAKMEAYLEEYGAKG